MLNSAYCMGVKPGLWS